MIWNADYIIKVLNIEKGKLFKIRVSFIDFGCTIPPRYPDFFKIIERGKYKGYRYKDKESIIKLYKLIESKDKKAPEELLKLQDYFNEIVNSLEFFDPIIKFSTPVIPDLSFRDSPSRDGKFIRLLTKGEKLELLEKGKEEAIEGKKGNWVKVKTEKGEMGWCFDGYLEEVK